MNYNLFPDYFNLECPAVCLQRLSVLVKTGLDLMAFNFTDFLVKNLFDKIKKRNNMFLVKWLDEDTNQNAANNILDVYLMLMFKLKKDSILLYQTVRFKTIHHVQWKRFFPYIIKALRILNKCTNIK